MLLSKHGLITEGLRPLDFEISSPLEAPIDATGALGWQPFDDEDVAKLIKLSATYIDLAPAISKQLEFLRKAGFSEDARHAVTEWAGSNLPCGDRISEQNNSFVYITERLVSLVHCSAGNLVSFHSGMRASEFLSSRAGFVRRDGGETIVSPDRLELFFTTFKTVNSLQGAERRITCHSRLLDACRALEKVKAAIGTPGDYLLVPPGDDLPYVTNTWNAKLQQFCDLHDLTVDIASHRWRKTVAAIAVRVLVGAALHLKELFGHENLAMTARYIMASPFIRDELGDLTLDEYRRRGRTLLESLVAFGGSGLGGRFGLELEERVTNLLSDVDVTQADLGKTLDEFVEEMLRVGIFPIPVMPGVFCAKPATARGECAKSSGDRLADPGRCSSQCAYQVQEAHRRDLVRWTVQRICTGWSHWSPLEQRYWAGQCRDQFAAWPDLVPELKQEIASWPALELAMKESGDGADA